MERTQNASGNCLVITTLGKFQVSRGDEMLSQDNNRSNHAWDLFKYIIANRYKGIVPELALEDLWPDQEYADPRGATRALIFRLRKLLSPSNEDYIKYAQGHYLWNVDSDFWLDIDEMENLAQCAEACLGDDPGRAEEYLIQALELYKGEFLPENFYSQWTIPVRNYYHSLCLRVVLDLVDLLKKRDDHASIIKVCEKVIISHPYEEEIHLHYLEGLLHEGRVQQAQKHWEYVNKKFYQDLGVRPSLVLQKVLQKVPGREDTGLDLTSIQSKLKQNTDHQGAFICTPEVFKEIYKLERRRGERSGIAVFMALLTLRGRRGADIEERVMQIAMDRLEEYLIVALRKGDVISRWSEKQYILILPSMAFEQGEMIMDRFKKGFNERNQRVEIVSEIQPVLPLEMYT
ncbi:MAG: AfsR/SARP family transcriptional regulator [Ignavibacteriales bacterium]